MRALALSPCSTTRTAADAGHRGRHTRRSPRWWVAALAWLVVGPFQAVPDARAQAPVQPPAPPSQAPYQNPYQPPRPVSLADETARVLAGMPVRGGSGMEAVAASAAARNHAAAMEEMWANWERFRLQRMREWAALTVQPQIPRPRTMFYLFGGPDLVSVVTLFPGADLYTLGGLEPVGQIPDLRQMSAEELAGSLDQIRFNLRSIQEKGFFETREMRADLARGSVSGVWPILALFAVRTGHEIIDWGPVGLDGNGEVVDGGGSGGPSGVRLRLRMLDPGPGFPMVQTVHYFTADISDGGIRANGRYLSYLQKQAPGGAYLKAASYLMHGGNFNQIRSFLLERPQFLLQDSSGVPARHFDPDVWEMQMYGRYAGPVETFQQHDQPLLREWFNGPVWRGPLPFGTNYRYTDEDAHQMLFFRRSANLPLRATAAPVAPPPGAVPPGFERPPPPVAPPASGPAPQEPEIRRAVPVPVPPTSPPSF